MCSRSLLEEWRFEFNKLRKWRPWSAYCSFDIVSKGAGKLEMSLGCASYVYSCLQKVSSGSLQRCRRKYQTFSHTGGENASISGGFGRDAQIFQYPKESATDARTSSCSGSFPCPGNSQELSADLTGASGDSAVPGLVFIMISP